MHKPKNGISSPYQNARYQRLNYANDRAYSERYNFGKAVQNASVYADFRFILL
jgi:hypothetical protein